MEAEVTVGHSTDIGFIFHGQQAQTSTDWAALCQQVFLQYILIALAHANTLNCTHVKNEKPDVHLEGGYYPSCNWNNYHVRSTPQPATYTCRSQSKKPPSQDHMCRVWESIIQPTVLKAYEKRCCELLHKFLHGNGKQPPHIPVIGPPQRFWRLLMDKHTAPHPDSTISPVPDEGQDTSMEVTIEEVAKAIRSFPSGSAGGPDGLHPQHLKVMIGFCGGWWFSTTGGSHFFHRSGNYRQDPTSSLELYLWCLSGCLGQEGSWC